MNKKAEVGFASLIIMTAMIIVAAVVVVTIWNLTPKVVSDARSVAESTQKNIGTATAIHKLYAEDGATGNSVDYFFMEVKPPFGSDEYKLSESLLVFAIQNTSREYLYNHLIDCELRTNASTSIYNSSNDNYFGVDYVAGAYTYNDTVMPGEFIRICWKSPESIVEDQFITTTFYNKNALTASLKVAYRGLISFDKTIYYFP